MMLQCYSCARKGPDAQCPLCTLDAEQCPECGDGLLMEIARGWLMCNLCRAMLSTEKLSRLDEQRASQRQRAEIMDCLREDRSRGRPGGNDPTGKAKARPRLGPPPPPPWDGDSSRKIAVERLIGRTVRPSRRLLEMCLDLGLTDARMLDLYRTAIHDEILRRAVDSPT